VLTTNIDPMTGVYTLPVNVGTPGQPLNLLFELGLYQDTWVNAEGCTNCAGHLFAPEKSSTFKANGTQYSKMLTPQDFVKGTYNYDTFNISNYTFSNNFFVLANLTAYPSGNGNIGFPYNTKDLKFDNTSLFDSLIKNQDNLKRVVAYKTISTTNGNLFLGAYPIELTNGVFPFTKCIANAEWGCKISRLGFGELKSLGDGHKLGNDTVSYDYAYFSFATTITAAPSYLLPYFNNTYFNGTLNNSVGTNCTIPPMRSPTDYGHYIIICPISYFNTTKFNDLYFVFDEASYRINGSNMFTTDDKEAMFNIAFYDNNSTTPLSIPLNSWLFGTNFLKNFITVFDGVQGNIGFYGPDVKDFSSTMTVTIIIITIAAVVVILGAIFLYFFCCRKVDDGYSAQN